MSLELRDRVSMYLVFSRRTGHQSRRIVTAAVTITSKAIDFMVQSGEPDDGGEQQQSGQGNVDVEVGCALTPSIQRERQQHPRSHGKQIGQQAHTPMDGCGNAKAPDYEDHWQ